MTTDSLPFTILPGLYLLGRHGMTPQAPHCHVYAIVSGEGLVLIDCGNGLAHDAILAAIASLAPPHRAVSHVLLTHCHVDHAMGAGAFRDLGAQLLAHDATARALERDLRQVWYEHTDRVHPVRVDRRLEDNEVLELGDLRVRVIATPGHTSGCLSFLVGIAGKQCLFTGDLVMLDGNPGWAGSIDFSEASVLQSLRRVQQIPFDVVLTGHSYLLEGGKELIATAIARGERGEWHLQR